MFRRRRGRGYVERGDYNLVNLHARETVKPESWTLQVTPGSTIVMNIILHSTIIEGETDNRQCPSCALPCNDASLEDATTWRARFCSSRYIFRAYHHIFGSPSCGTSFLISKVDIQKPTIGPSEHRNHPMWPALLNSTEEDRETLDIHCFRRFHVVLTAQKVYRMASMLDGGVLARRAYSMVNMSVGSLPERRAYSMVNMSIGGLPGRRAYNRGLIVW